MPLAWGTSGQIGLEPDIGGPGEFFGVGLHETQIDEAAADRGWRNGDLVALLEVPENGVRLTRLLTHRLVRIPRTVLDRIQYAVHSKCLLSAT